jgi:hypothetical protein
MNHSSSHGYASVLASGPQLGNPDGFLLNDGELSWVTFFGHEVRRLTASGKIIMDAPLPAVDVTGLKLGPNPLPPGALILDGYARWHDSLLVTSWVRWSGWTPAQLTKSASSAETLRRAPLKDPARRGG